MESDTEKTQTEDSLDNNATYACKDLEDLDDDPFAESTTNGESSNVATAPAIHYSNDCEQKLREQTLSVLRVIFGQNLNANKKPNSPTKQPRKKKRKSVVHTRQVETSYKRKSNHSNNNSAQQKLHKMNSTTCNAETLKALTLYLTKRKALYQPISIDHIHNLILHNKVYDFCDESSAVGTAHQDITQSLEEVEIIQIIVFKLVECLWKCVQYTPYIRNTKRRSEVFRPFAAGVIFAMRRGIQLDDGSYIVPKCQAIKESLDSISLVQRGTERHAIHLLAHRGVNVLQRCILSIESSEALATIFADAIQIADNFDNACRTRRRIL